jgi:probable DNA repair protein
VQAWAELLDTFSGLDAVTGEMSLEEAARRLRRIGAERRFQPETPPLPVQVLGLLETSGLEFDALWVSGMQDGVLPATLRPCALLPARMQRERGMPRACPDTELAIARRLVARVGSTAAEVFFSYPETRDDEPLRPSPVIAALAAAAPAIATGSIAASMFRARRIESVSELRAPPVAGELRGGTGLLAVQSACPFQAFAVHRLKARAMDVPASGVDPGTRGSFIHAALSELWAVLGDSAALKALDAAARKRTIRTALERAAAEHLAELPAGLAAIELDDAARRMAELLDIEALRNEFEVVQREQSVSIELGPLKIRGRADRVDRVADGLVVIDYKTGQANPSSWDGERPAEPQMPLYAMVYRAQLAGLAYASLKPGAVGIQGRARSQASFGQVLPQRNICGDDAWTEALDQWQRVLQALADAFASGDARVDPLRPLAAGGSCSWCHLGTLCRRDELLRAGAIGND